MKKILSILCLSLVFITSCGNDSNTETTETTETTEVNQNTENETSETTTNESEKQMLPNPKFYTLDGGQVDLASFRGKPLVFNLWASWCPPCREEIPNFEIAHENYKEEVEFALVSLQDGDRETPESAINFIVDNKYQLPFYLDSDQQVSYAFMVTSIPVTYFINSDGTLYSRHIGLITKDGLEEQIEGLIENNK